MGDNHLDRAQALFLSSITAAKESTAIEGATLDEFVKVASLADTASKPLKGLADLRVDDDGASEASTLASSTGGDDNDDADDEDGDEDEDDEATARGRGTKSAALAPLLLESGQVLAEVLTHMSVAGTVEGASDMHCSSSEPTPAVAHHVHHSLNTGARALSDEVNSRLLFSVSSRLRTPGGSAAQCSTAEAPGITLRLLT